MQGGGAKVIGGGGKMGRVGEGEGRRMESRPRLIVKELLVADVGGGRHPDSGFSDSSDSSVVVEDEAEVKVTKRRGEKDRGEKEEEKDRTVRRRAEKEGAVGGLSVSFYSVTDMIRDRSLQLDINSNLFTSECLTSTSFMDAEEGEEEELDKVVGLSEKRPKVGRSNPVPGHLRGLAEVMMGGKGGLVGDLDGMDCPLQAWLGGPQGSRVGGGPVDSWLGEVRGVQEAECSTMLQSKPIR